MTAGPETAPHANGPALGVLVRIFPKLSETFILEEILGLERLGLRLHLYSLDPPTDALTHAAVRRVKAPHRRVPALGRGEGVDIVRRHLRLAARRPLGYLAALGAAIGRGSAGLRDFVQAGCLADQMRRDGVDCLHAHFVSRPADVAALAATAAGLPLSLSAHAKDIYLSAPADLRRRLRSARFAVTCTEANRQALLAVAAGTTVERMYHGIDLGAFHPRHRQAPDGARPLLLAIGRLRAKKGLDTLVAACALLRDRGRAFDCEIVGYGEEHDRLQRQIAAAGLADRVVLRGKLAREPILACYARAAVFVQPSRIAADGDRDGIPNVLLEAMAMGLPVVASDVSGIPELVQHDVSGLLVPPDDVARLAEAIVRCLDQPGLAGQLGRAARSTVVERFDNDRNLAELVRLLEHADDRRRLAVA